MMTKEQLKEVFARYLRGQWPTEAEIAAAPRLNNWSVIIVEPYITHAPEMCLKGECTGHPILPDEKITTSTVLWIDKELRLAHTMSRLYVLGEPAGRAGW